MLENPQKEVSDVADYAKLSVRIEALTQDFERGMRRASSEAQGFGNRMKEIGGRM